MTYEIDAFGTLVIAVFFLFIGRYLVSKISFFRNYNLPEPVIGGLVAAITAFILYKLFNISATFDAQIQTILMLMFFTSVGLSADFLKLKEGGKSLLIFLVCVIEFSHSAWT